MDCIICNEETETKTEGICLDCQKKILKALNVTVEFSDKEPYVKVTPQNKEPLYELIAALSDLVYSVDYNFHAVKHHSHSRKEIEVVDVE